MPTLEENVNRVKAAKTAIGAAITAKGGTVGANDGLEDFATDIASIPSGGGGSSVEKKDVNFYDYDGTVVNSYTAAEFAELSAFPENPSHDGLTAQGWNWDTLANAKTYVASYGKLNIGQMYITSDGKTRLYIRLGEGRLKPYLGLTGNSSGTAVSIDWGDGSAAESVTLDTSTVYTPHVYTSAGYYVIVITIISGSISFKGDSTTGSNIFRKSGTPNSNGDITYQNILTKLEIGSSVTAIGLYAFRSCNSLTSITIPSSVTNIGGYAFYNCSSLKSVTIPSSVTSIVQDAFENCRSLTSVTIPNSVTSIDSSAFAYCSSLTSVTIPSSVTSLGNTSFQYCFSLTSITIPSSVTAIPNSLLTACNSLTSITIPSSVTSIGKSAFSSCYGVGFIKFIRTTPASAGTSSFNGIPIDCIIYVPTGSLSDYTSASASNYPSSSTYSYVEY